MTTLIISGCANHTGGSQTPAEIPPASWAFDQLDPQVYTPEHWPEALTATVYRPKRSGLMPAVLVVHGGGWARRSPDDMTRISKSLAARGFVAVNVAYRLAPQYLYPAPLKDLQQAMRWIVENAEALQIDPHRIGAFGYSAGAHLVSLLAVTESQEDAEPSNYRVKAVVAGGTPADLTRWPKSGLVKTFLGEPYDQSQERWTQASPITHVSPASPPFFLYHGGMDALVEVEQALALKQKLDAAGVHAELFTVPYHGHISMFVLNRSAVRRGAAFLDQMLR